MKFLQLCINIYHCCHCYCESATTILYWNYYCFLTDCHCCHHYCDYHHYWNLVIKITM